MTTPEEYIQYAEVQLLQADMAGEPERHTLIAQAKDALVKAEQLEPGCAAWRVACLNAREGKGDLCQKWLELARGAGALPDADTLRSHADLARVRGQKWFKRLLRDIT